MDHGSRPGVVVAICAFVALGVGGFAGFIGGAVAVWWTDFAMPVPSGDDVEYGSDDTPWFDGELGRDLTVALDSEIPDRHVRLTLPDDAIAVRLRAVSPRGDIRLNARFSDDGTSPWAADTDWEGTDPAEVVTLDLADPVTAAFAPGRFEVCVRADGDVGKGERIDVRLRVDVVRPQIDATLAPGDEWRGETSAESGFRRTFAVTVPAGATALRLDVADATGDLDLHVGEGKPLTATADAVTAAEGFGSAEWIVLDAESDPPLAPGGTLFVTVNDPSALDVPLPFRLVVTAGADAPPDLARTPPLPEPTDPRARALLSVVEVLLDDGGSGSGTLVADDGRVVTAYHVVEGAARAVADGRPEDAPRIVIAVSLDPREMARDLFVAEVVHADHELDVAMLQIVGGVRGTDLPPGYRFPFVKPSRRTPRFLGETLFTVGYPAAGGVGTRVTQTLSRGVVAGYGRAKRALEIKTDAIVAPGSSGGAAFDDRWELVGVPVSTTDGGSAGTVLGHIVPVESIPEAWWR